VLYLVRGYQISKKVETEFNFHVWLIYILIRNLNFQDFSCLLYQIRVRASHRWRFLGVKEGYISLNFQVVKILLWNCLFCLLNNWQHTESSLSCSMRVERCWQRTGCWPKKNSLCVTDLKDLVLTLSKSITVKLISCTVWTYSVATRETVSPSSSKICLRYVFWATLNSEVFVVITRPTAWVWTKLSTELFQLRGMKVIRNFCQK